MMAAPTWQDETEEGISNELLMSRRSATRA
jgi:hypothetical protein